MSLMNPAILKPSAGDAVQERLPVTLEGMIEKKLEDIATILCTSVKGKSKLHEEVMAMVERSLFRIALKHSNHVKSAAASYLGINRNTFQTRMKKLGITEQKD